MQTPTATLPRRFLRLTFYNVLAKWLAMAACMLARAATLEVARRALPALAPEDQTP